MKKQNNLRNDKKKFRLRIYKYVLRLIRFLTQLPNTPVAKEIKSQLTRSGTSIGANYFESDAASSKKDYLNFFRHALKSANESKFWLSVLVDSKLVPEKLVSEAREILQETKELADIFAASIITMKGKR